MSKSSEKQIKTALSIRDQILADENLAKMASPEAWDARAEFAEEVKPLSPETVEATIKDVMPALFNCFREPELRIMGNNGRRYPIHYDFGSGDVQPAEPFELVVVDKYEFLGTSLAKGLCYALENMLVRQEANIDRQRKSIRSELLFGNNRGVDVTAKVDRMADFLEAMVDQAAFTRIALYSASEQLAALTGEGHVTKAQKEQVVASRKTEVASTPAAARALALGVNLD